MVVEMPDCVPRSGLCYVFVTSPHLVLFHGCRTSQLCTQTHVRHHHARTDPDAVYSTRNEDKRLEFLCLAPLCFLAMLASHLSLSLITPSQVCSPLEPKKGKPRRTPLLLFFLSGNKNKLNGKTQVYYLFFSNSRHNVDQYSNLSV